MIESHSPGEMSLSKHYHFLAILIAAYGAETITRWLGEKAKQWDELLRFHFSFMGNKKNCCVSLATDFDRMLIFYKEGPNNSRKAKRDERGNINTQIKLSSLINCVAAAVFYALQPLTCWHFHPAPTAAAKTLPGTSGVLRVDYGTHPTRQQIVCVPDSCGLKCEL